MIGEVRDLAARAAELLRRLTTATPKRMFITQKQFGQNLFAARWDKKIDLADAARRVGLTTAVLKKIEAGEHAVTSLQFDRLGALYECDLLDFFNPSAPRLTMRPRLFHSADQSGDAAATRRAVSSCLRQFNAANALWRIRDVRLPDPPILIRSAPREVGQALAQAQWAAREERRRIGLGSGPIEDIWTTVADQGVGLGLVDMPADVSGMMLPENGKAPHVFVNRRDSPARRNFSLAHEYAHILLDRADAPGVISEDDASDLREVRANAFASEFLLPRADLKVHVPSLRTTGDARGTMTVSEVEAITQRYQVSWSAALVALRRAGLLDADATERLRETIPHQEMRSARDLHQVRICETVFADLASYAFHACGDMDVERLAEYLETVMEPDRAEATAERIAARTHSPLQA